MNSSSCCSARTRGDRRAGSRALLEQDLAEALIRAARCSAQRTLELLGGDGAVADEQRSRGQATGSEGFLTASIFVYRHAASC